MFLFSYMQVSWLKSIVGQRKFVGYGNTYVAQTLKFKIYIKKTEGWGFAWRVGKNMSMPVDRWQVERLCGLQQMHIKAVSTVLKQFLFLLCIITKFLPGRVPTSLHGVEKIKVVEFLQMLRIQPFIWCTLCIKRESDAFLTPSATLHCVMYVYFVPQ